MGGGSGGSPAAVWANFCLMSAFTLLFMRASYHSRSKTSRVYHYMTTLITGIAALAYLIIALEIGGVWVRFLDWFLTTPMLLADLAFLAGMNAPEVAYLCVIDMMMVASGYASEMSYKPGQVWGMFAFSAIMFGIIVAALLAHLRDLVNQHNGTVEAKAYKFLSVWTLVLWSVYPILFILEKTDTMDPATEDIMHTVLDVLAKGIFGVILVGSREALEGESTGESLLAMAVIGIDPLKRRASMTGAHMAAVDMFATAADGPSSQQATVSKATGETLGKNFPLSPTAGGASQHLGATLAAAPSQHERPRVLQHSKYSDRNLRATSERAAQREAEYDIEAPPADDASYDREPDYDSDGRVSVGGGGGKMRTGRGGVSSARSTAAPPAPPAMGSDILMQAILQAAQRDPSVVVALMGMQQQQQPSAIMTAPPAPMPVDLRSPSSRDGSSGVPSRRDSDASDPRRAQAYGRTPSGRSFATVDGPTLASPPRVPQYTQQAAAPPAASQAEMAERLQALLRAMGPQAVSAALGGAAPVPELHMSGGGQGMSAGARASSRRRGSLNAQEDA